MTAHDTAHDRGSERPGTRSIDLRHSRPARVVALVGIFLVTLVLASAWLVFPYLVEGRTVLEDISAEVNDQRNAQARTLGQLLTRYADGPGEAEVDVLYATPTYFARTSSQRVTDQYDPDTFLVFFVNAGVHTGELPQSLPEARLVVDGRSFEPIDREGPVLTDHHRTTIIRFDRTDPNGDPILHDGVSRITLEIANHWDPANTTRQVSWELPIDYPAETEALSSPVLIMALAAGLLSATLTPCLLQLIVVYMATLTGLGAEQLGQSGVVPAEARRKMMLIALAFVIGFMAFYTAAGALIGYAGKTAQLVFSDYNRQAGIGAGILVILMGLWMGIRARAPLLCRIPAPAMMKRLDTSGFVRSALLAAGFSLGCMVCFSGAIVATLLIYVGAIGSATIGALILFVFSLGVAIPFLAAALFLSRTITVMDWISRYTPQLALVSTVIVVAFGVVLITDNFHTLSDLIYPWLGLS